MVRFKLNTDGSIELESGNGFIVTDEFKQKYYTYNIDSEYFLNNLQGYKRITDDNIIRQRIKDILGSWGESRIVKVENIYPEKQITEESVMPFVAMISYLLAMVDVESANTFNNVREAFFLGYGSEAWVNYINKNSFYGDFYTITIDGQIKRVRKFYGRGHIQVTSEGNYKKVNNIAKEHYDLDFDFVNNPDLLVQPDLYFYLSSLASLDMTNNSNRKQTFTESGKRLIDYFKGGMNKWDWLGARDTVNPGAKLKERTDIKKKALDFYNAMRISINFLDYSKYYSVEQFPDWKV